MAGLLSKALDRFSPDRAEADEPADDAAPSGCRPISEVTERSTVSIHGVLRSVTLRPVDGVTALEAELYDGSASVTLVWLGRRRIVGIAPGRSLTAHGRLGRRAGAKVLYNPRYQLDA